MVSSCAQLVEMMGGRTACERAGAICTCSCACTVEKKENDKGELFNWILPSGLYVPPKAPCWEDDSCFVGNPYSGLGDQNSQCNVWANQGTCGTNPKYMVKTCALSCAKWENGELEPPSNQRTEGDYRDVYEPAGEMTDSVLNRGGDRRRHAKGREGWAKGRRHTEYLGDLLVFGQCFKADGAPEAECTYGPETCPAQVSEDRCESCPLWQTGDLSSCYGGKCMPCPRGAVCFGGASWPRIAPGYWSPNVWKVEGSQMAGFGSNYECTPSKACMGDDGFGTPVCAYGYEQSTLNTLCVQCETAAGHRHYKLAGAGECLKCPKDQWMFGVAFFCFGFIVVIFGFIPGMYFMLGRLMGLGLPIPRIWKYSCVICLVKGIYNCGKRLAGATQRAAEATTCCSWDDK